MCPWQTSFFVPKRWCRNPLKIKVPAPVFGNKERRLSLTNVFLCSQILVPKPSKKKHLATRWNATKDGINACPCCTLSLDFHFHKKTDFSQKKAVLLLSATSFFKYFFKPLFVFVWMSVCYKGLKTMELFSQWHGVIHILLTPLLYFWASGPH